MSKTAIRVTIVLSQGREMMSWKPWSVKVRAAMTVAGKGLGVAAGVFLDDRSSEPALESQHEFSKETRRMRGFWAELPARKGTRPACAHCPWHAPGPRASRWVAQDTVCSGTPKKLGGRNGEAGRPVKESTGRVRIRGDEPSIRMTE